MSMLHMVCKFFFQFCTVLNVLDTETVLSHIYIHLKLWQLENATAVCLKQFSFLKLKVFEMLSQNAFEKILP